MRRHGTRYNPSDVRMVAATGNIENRFRWILIENWSDDGQIGQMRPTGFRMIGEVNISSSNFFNMMDLISYCFLHCTQMDRNMRGIGHQASVRTKQSARKVQTFLNKFQMISIFDITKSVLFEFDYWVRWYLAVFSALLPFLSIHDNCDWWWKNDDILHQKFSQFFSNRGFFMKSFW